MTTKFTPRPIPVSFRRPKLFGAAFTRSVVDSSSVGKISKGQTLSDSNIQNTSSFRYDSPGLGLRSTQQIPLDWSLFENHTFFNSAEANVNVAFDKIINEFPFDGTQKEFEDFLDNLTGFEKYVFDSFPRNIGYLHFLSASQTYIKVNDFEGVDHLQLAKNTSGNKILDPGTKSFTIEGHFLFASASNNDQVICENLVHGTYGNEYGYAVFLNTTASADYASASIGVVSGTQSMVANVTVPKGQFVHLAFTFNRKPGVNRLEIYRDGELVSTSDAGKKIEMGEFGFVAEPFYIGTGGPINALGFTQTDTFNGSIDEFRIFHNVRTGNELKRSKVKNIFARDDLKLYFKFNEPTGSLGDLTHIVLDSSGNSLHSYIVNFTGSMRTTGSGPTVPVTGEKIANNPVLFPKYTDVINLNINLLTSASAYDEKNPNLITRLVPNHYFVEGQYFEGLQAESGTMGDPYTGGDIPGSGELGTAQVLSAFLFVWAKYFDELKIFIDHLSKVLHVDYDTAGTVSDQFLPFVFKHYGFDVPGFFSNATIGQFVNAENVNIDYGTSENSLQYVQSQIWRRILANLGDIVRSKGTIHSIKSLIRSVGINPDNTLRIREFGGPTERRLIEQRQNKTEISALLDFSGTIATVTPSLSADTGFSSNIPWLQSSFLTSSRLEVGFPYPAGTFVSGGLTGSYPIHGISDQRTDGNLTSGSWTYEGIYKFEKLLTGSHFITQSLVRFASTGSHAAGHIVWANVLAMTGTDGTRIKLFARPSSGSSLTNAPLLELQLSGANVFDGNVWNVSFGRTRNDSFTSINTNSSSWFLRAGRQHYGEIAETYTTSTFFLETTGSATNILMQGDVTSGSFFTIGSQSIATSGMSSYNLNSSLASEEARYTNFTGKVGQIRFWSKDLTVKEWEEHVYNFKSLGVSDPTVNFNFDTQVTGAFERLRVDAAIDQPVTNSDSTGNIQIFDFSQNGFHITGGGFETSRQVIKPEIFYFSYISPHIDEVSTNNKIRVRGYQKQPNVDRFASSVSPIYEISPSEIPNDDTRFTIDFSIIDALDEDIIKMFSVLDFFDNAIGNPELSHSPDYPDLERMRTIYFNRLTDNINLKGFFEFFKWFDGSIGLFIEQLLPRKTNYLGTNFVIESHMLERSKVQYMDEEVYLEDNLRSEAKITSFEEPEGSVQG